MSAGFCSIFIGTTLQHAQKAWNEAPLKSKAWSAMIATLSAISALGCGICAWKMGAQPFKLLCEAVPPVNAREILNTSLTGISFTGAGFLGLVSLYSAYRGARRAYKTIRQEKPHPQAVHNMIARFIASAQTGYLAYRLFSFSRSATAPPPRPLPRIF